VGLLQGRQLGCDRMRKRACQGGRTQGKVQVGLSIVWDLRMRSTSTSAPHVGRRVARKPRPSRGACPAASCKRAAPARSASARCRSTRRCRSPGSPAAPRVAPRPPPWPRVTRGSAGAARRSSVRRSRLDLRPWGAAFLVARRLRLSRTALPACCCSCFLSPHPPRPRCCRAAHSLRAAALERSQTRSPLVPGFCSAGA